MCGFLKNHPFAIEAFFETSLVLTFAVPVQQLAPLIPAGLQADTWRNTWGFVAMAIVNTKDLRPRGFPRFMGNDFFLIGYRIFVTCHTAAGKRLRGLYILRSETDSPRMTRLGNLFSHYKYTTTDIQYTKTPDRLTLRSQASQINITIDTTTANTPLPDSSPFADWKEARRFAGPLPFTFTPLTADTFLVIEGVRQQWVPQPVRVLHHEAGFLASLGFAGAALANAFSISHVPYYWKPGRKIQWKP